MGVRCGGRRNTARRGRPWRSNARGRTGYAGDYDCSGDEVRSEMASAQTMTRAAWVQRQTATSGTKRLTCSRAVRYCSSAAERGIRSFPRTRPFFGAELGVDIILMAKTPTASIRRSQIDSSDKDDRPPAATIAKKLSHDRRPPLCLDDKYPQHNAVRDRRRPNICERQWAPYWNVITVSESSGSLTSYGPESEKGTYTTTITNILLKWKRRSPR